MVVLLDLEALDDVRDPHVDPHTAANGLGDLKPQLRSSLRSTQRDGEGAAAATVAITEEEAGAMEEPSKETTNPNLNAFSACLGCYPIVSQLASFLDLNTIDDLSRTCRQFRANLLQYRKQLVAQSLRCSNEDKLTVAEFIKSENSESRPGSRAGAGFPNGGASEPRPRDRVGLAYPNADARLTSGKVGKCARDMVAECRRCGTVVCRNCTIKPPPMSALDGRLRRLCRTCARAPLSSLCTLRRPDESTSPTSTPPRTQSPLADNPAPSATSLTTAEPAFTAPAFIRTPCCCPTNVWLCQPCGQSLRSADTTYMRGWTWRTRYSTYLGGLGTGIGEGNEGVQCARASACFGAHTVEHECECDCASQQQLDQEARKVVAAAAAATDDDDDVDGTAHRHRWHGSSFHVQEIEGIGGVMRRKVRKRRRVGQVVKEYEDERENRTPYLSREREGKLRAWCAWCDRVVPGVKDVASGEVRVTDGGVGVGVGAGAAGVYGLTAAALVMGDARVWDRRESGSSEASEAGGVEAD